MDSYLRSTSDGSVYRAHPSRSKVPSFLIPNGASSGVLIYFWPPLLCLSSAPLISASPLLNANEQRKSTVFPLPALGELLLSRIYVDRASSEAEPSEAPIVRKQGRALLHAREGSSSR